MSFKNLPKALIDSVVSTIQQRNSEYDNLRNSLISEGLKKFGVKREVQLSEDDRRCLRAWVEMKVNEICPNGCGCENYAWVDDPSKVNEDDMPNDEVYHKDGNRMGPKKFEIDESEASDVVKAELEKMGKSLGELSPEEKKALFNKVDSLVKAKNEELDEASSQKQAIDAEIRKLKAELDSAMTSYDSTSKWPRKKVENIFAKIEALVNKKNSLKEYSSDYSTDADKKEIQENIALEPDEIATNKAVAVGSAMSAEPVHADVLKDRNPLDGTFQYRLLLQYTTGGEIYLGAPYEGTHIYPPVSMPGAASIDMLRDMIEGMPFYNRVVEKALKTSLEIPSIDPKFKTTNQVNENVSSQSKSAIKEKRSKKVK